jgi:hypothetical protein
MSPLVCDGRSMAWIMTEQIRTDVMEPYNQKATAMTVFEKLDRKCHCCDER